MSLPRTSAATGPRAVLSPDEFGQLAAVVARRTGLQLLTSKQPEIEWKLREPLVALGSGQALARRLESEDDLLQEVVEHLTVGESYFFRNRPHFAALREQILPRLIAGARERRTLRIWSAGCATGEEPYSVAMLLQEHFPELDAWSIEITGTDLNTRFLARAERGRYGPWSFRQVEPHLRERYFRSVEDERWRVGPSLRGAVRFRPLNLAAPPYRAAFPEDLDLILCRNVLIYFEAAAADRVIRSLAQVLRPGGYLMTGHAEAFPALGELRAVYGSATFYYQRQDPGTAPHPRAVSPPVCRVPGLAVVSAPASAVTWSPARPRRATSPSRPRGPREDRRVEPAPDRGSAAVEALLDAARARANAGELAAARDLILQLPEQAWQLDHRVHFLRALLADQIGHPEEAEASLRQALFLKRDFVAAHYYRGILAERNGEWRAARRCFANVTALLSPLPETRELEETGGLTAGRLLEIAVERLHEAELHLGPGGKDAR